MLTGAILAGGQNRGMDGKVKALLPFAGQLLIERQIERMKPICDEIIVVTNQPNLFLPVLDRSIRIITDYYPGKGPLSGIHSALTLARNRDVWVVGCDMPFISAKAARVMQEMKQTMNCDAVIPVLDGRVEPLHGIYSNRCGDAASALLASGESRLSEWFRLLYWQDATATLFRGHQIDLDFVISINTHEDYREALSRASSLQA